MSLEQITEIFRIMTIINFSLLMFSTFMMVVAKDLVYKIQTKFIPISQEETNISMYNLLGIYKILIIIFNFVPYIALVTVGG